MRIDIHATEQIVLIDSVKCRVWTGRTARGTPCRLLIHNLTALEERDAGTLNREAVEELPPERQVSALSALFPRGIKSPTRHIT